MRFGKVRSTAYSLLLHAALFALLAYHGLRAPGQQAAQQPQGTPDQITAEIVDKPSEKDEQISFSQPEEKGGADERTPHAKDSCPKFFGGIGITQGFNPYTSYPVVIEVHHGYPAEKAGVRVGDYLLNDNEIRGEIGTEFVLQLLRDGQPLTMTIVRDKICIEEGDKP